MTGETDPRTNAQKMAGNMHRAFMFTCVHCTSVQAIFDPDEPALGQPAALEAIRAKGWVQRRGAWCCPKCAKDIKAPKPKLNIRKGNLTLIK